VKTIHHVLDIDAGPERVWAALTEAKGLAGWWSTKLETGAPEVGSLIRFTFAGDFNPVMEIVTIDGGTALTWRCTEGHKNWDDLPDPPAKVLDVGGGTGAHAAWLADEGYDVHVVDLTPGHVDTVSAQLGPRGVTAELGDARRLTQPDDAFDVALLPGPLYHLTDRDDRVGALREAARVVRREGMVVAAAINRFASLFDGVARGFLSDDRFRTIVERDLRDGQHRNPTGEPHWFTTAFFHRPEDLAGEADEAGLRVLGLFGVEGLAGWLPQLDALWATADGRETILDAVRATESEVSLRGLSPHMLLVTNVAPEKSFVSLQAFSADS
jgi:ubiquinone/menaquinone biosynthesis C-methylase UbiE